MPVRAAIEAAALAAQAVAGVEVRYRRGTEELTLVAIPGRTVYEVTDLDGRLITVQGRDYLVIASELVLAGVPVAPDRNDEIIESEPDGEHTYKALEVPGGKCWRWSDEQHVRYRIHTTEVAKP